VLTYLMNNISREAASDPLVKGFFATGEIQFWRKKSIYGLVQCTRDLSDASCDSCLVSALGDLLTCCDSREGGIIVSRNCNMRFGLYQFYNASSVVITYPSSQGKDIIILIDSLSMHYIILQGKLKQKRKKRRNPILEFKIVVLAW
jgi:hypothetical protein